MHPESGCIHNFRYNEKYTLHTGDDVCNTRVPQHRAWVIEANSELRNAGAHTSVRYQLLRGTDYFVHTNSYCVKVRSYIAQYPVLVQDALMLYPPPAPPGKPVISNTSSTSLGSFQPRCNYCAKTIRSHISTTVYNQVLIYTAE